MGRRRWRRRQHATFLRRLWGRLFAQFVEPLLQFQP
jgi:hypothetical protein